MLDHCSLTRATQISFLPSQPVSAVPLAGPPQPWLMGREGAQGRPHLCLQPSDVETHRDFDPLGDLKTIAISCHPSEHMGGPWRGHPGPG